VPSATSADTVNKLLIERGLRRLAVIDHDGTLLGLMCLKRSRTGFCSDEDVASRAQSRVLSRQAADRDGRGWETPPRSTVATTGRTSDPPTTRCAPDAR
jgi:hypothetical protein